MKYAAQMDSGAMIYSYIACFMTIGLGIQTFIGEGDTQTAR
jgi:hypothetical protein